MKQHVKRILTIVLSILMVITSSEFSTLTAYADDGAAVSAVETSASDTQTVETQSDASAQNTSSATVSDTAAQTQEETTAGSQESTAETQSESMDTEADSETAAEDTLGTSENTQAADAQPETAMTSTDTQAAEEITSESEQEEQETSDVNVSSESQESKAQYEIRVAAVDAADEDHLLEGVTLEIVKGKEDTEDAEVAASITTKDSADNLVSVQLEPGYYLVRNTDPASEYAADETISFYVCKKGYLFVRDPDTDEYERSDHLAVACSRTAEASLMKADSVDVEDTYTMQHSVIYCALGQVYTMEGPVWAYHNGVTSCGDSRMINFFAYLSVAHDGRNDVYGKVNDLVAEKDPDDTRPQIYGALILPGWTVSFENEDDHQYTFGDELLEWGRSRGYNWTEDTEISDVSMDVESGVRFTDENGNEAALLDSEESVYRAPYIDYIWDADSAVQVGGAEYSDTYDMGTASSVLYHETGYTFQRTDDEEADSFTFREFPNLERSFQRTTSDPNIKYDYSGSVTFNCVLNYTFSFKVKDEQGVERQYKVTLKVPEINPTFKISKGDGRHLNVSGGDITAAVHSQNSETVESTENEHITAVQKGDTIDYSIDISGDAERQMLTWFYTSAGTKQVTTGQVEGYPINQQYFDLWSQPCVTSLADLDLIVNLMKPRLKVTFTLPEEGLEAPEALEDAITITSSKPDVASWEIDRSLTNYDENTGTVTIYVSMDPLDIPQPDPQGDEKITEGIDDIGQPDGDGWSEESQKKIQDFLEALDGNQVCITIPGITVRSDAKINTPYTAKATVRGNMFYGAFPYESILGNEYGGSVAPVGSKESTFDPEEIEGIWDDSDNDADSIWDDSDNDTDVFSAAASDNSSSDVTEAQAEDSCGCGKTNPKKAKSFDSEFLETGFFDYESDDQAIWTPDQYEAYDPSGILDLENYDSQDVCYTFYYWDYVQTPEGKDCIQQEKYSKELWYTVIIPAATISKDLPDDASEADLSKAYTFGIQLKDEDLFGQNFEAVRGVKQDDGTVSYDSTSETVAFDDTGCATITLKAGEVLAIGLPDGCAYTVKEILEDDSYAVGYRYVSAAGDETVSTGTYRKNDGIDGKVEAARYTESDAVDVIDVTGENFPTGSLSVAKRLIVPEDDMPEEADKEFRFVLTLSNDAIDVNSDYTVKLYTGGVYDENLGAFTYTEEPAEETRTIADGKLEFSLKQGQTLEIDGLPEGTDYTVEEVESQGFTPVYTDQTGTITAHASVSALCENSYTEVTVNKVWAGDAEEERPSSVQMQLYKNGQPDGEPVTITADDGWSYTWDDLEAGQTYTVAEVNVPGGYTDSVTHKDNIWTVTNTKQPTDTPEEPPEEPETQSVRVDKIWKNDDPSARPDSVQMQLYKNGQPDGDPVTVTANDGWSYTWDDLEAGQTYAVAEVNVPDGYTDSITHEDNVWTVTNTRLSEVKTAIHISDHTPVNPEAVKTGDSTPIGKWLAILIIAAAVVVLLIVLNHKKRHTDDDK